LDLGGIDERKYVPKHLDPGRDEEERMWKVIVNNPGGFHSINTITRKV